jgi:hypothetical protein
MITNQNAVDISLCSLSIEVAQDVISRTRNDTAAFKSIDVDAARLLAKEYNPTTNLLSSQIAGKKFNYATFARLDLCGLKILTHDAAKALSEWGRNCNASFIELNLSGLERIEINVATELRQWCAGDGRKRQQCVLLLDGLKEASLETIEQLASWHPHSEAATISLDGMGLISPAALAKLSLWKFGGYSQLSLNQSGDFCNDRLAAIAGFSGNSLTLGVKKLTKATAELLLQFGQDELSLPKLETVEAEAWGTIEGSALSKNCRGPIPKQFNLGDWHCSRQLSGIDKKSAGTILRLRQAGVKVELNKVTNAAVYANGTAADYRNLPLVMETSIKDGKHEVRCPFCTMLAGNFLQPKPREESQISDGGYVSYQLTDPFEWADQWTINKCPHLDAAQVFGIPLDLVENSSKPNKPAGRIEHRVIEWRDADVASITFKFSPD